MNITSAVVATAAALLLGLAQVDAAVSAPTGHPLPPLPSPLSTLLSGSADTTTPAAAAPSSGTARQGKATTARFASPLQRSIVAEINGLRRSFGRSRLTLSTQLLHAGQQHARELALHGLFAHEWTDGSPFGTWIQRFYPRGAARFWSAGENLAWSTPDLTAARAADLWLKSPAHRRTLLDRRWKQVGVGVVEAGAAPGIYGGGDVVIVAGEFGVRR
jgi:uncharacterized protein YkwD